MSAPAQRTGPSSPAFRIALLYILLGVIWILVSDHLAETMTPTSGAATRLQTLKGWFFVVGSGFFFYLLIDHYWTARSRSEAAERESRRMLDNLVVNLPGMVYRARPGPERVFELAGEASRRITGYPYQALLSTGPVKYGQIIVAEDRPEVERTISQALAQRTSFMATYRIRTAADEERWVSDHGVGVYASDGRLEAIEGFISDITEQKRYEQQMFQTEKMNAVGRMAAGVAHDLNNVLFAILGLAELLESRFSEGSQERQYAGEIREAGERAAALVRQLLDIARRRPSRTEVVDLALLARNLEGFLQRVVGKPITLQLRLPEQPARVEADPSQLEQILMNLAINARDAMQDGGTLTLAVESARVEDTSAYGPPDLRPGDYTVLLVSDTGCGMDEATRRRIFEPFFTTKPPEQGTGLGLTTSYGIVQQCGGSIHVYSETGRGTTFRIYLPRVEQAAAGAPPEPLAPGSGTVLVVDDEELVLRLVCAVLEGAGYQTLPSRNAAEALAFSQELAQAPQLIVTDLILPGMNGRELAQRLRARHPGTPVLYMSGFADHMLFRREELGADEAYLEKPLTPQQLIRKLNRLLGARRA